VEKTSQVTRLNAEYAIFSFDAFESVGSESGVAVTQAAHGEFMQRAGRDGDVL
jgi:hypothetical protein